MFLRDKTAFSMFLTHITVGLFDLPMFIHLLSCIHKNRKHLLFKNSSYVHLYIQKPLINPKIEFILKILPHKYVAYHAIMHDRITTICWNANRSCIQIHIRYRFNPSCIAY